MIVIISAVCRLSGKHKDFTQKCASAALLIKPCVPRNNYLQYFCVSHPVVGDFMSRPAAACHPAVGKSDISSSPCPL